MTKEQAETIKVGDRVVIQRIALPTPHYGSVTRVGHEITIKWDGYMHDGDEYGGSDSKPAWAFAAIERSDDVALAIEFADKNP